MEAGRFFGRVGGLAVALGIGAAIASSPGVAVADGTEGSAGPSAESSASPTSARADSAKSTKDSEGGTRSDFRDDQEADADQDTAEAEAADVEDDAAADQIADDDLEPARDDDPAEPIDEIAPREDIVDAEDAEDVESPTASTHSASTTDLGSFETTPAAVTTVVESRLVATAQTRTDPQPATPQASPSIWMAAAWVRREIQYLLGNRAVTAQPTQVSAELTGERAVYGTLDALGPNGNAVAYTLTTQPREGTVEVHADGTYTYIPQEGFPAAGGRDGFEVTITDAGFHLEHLFGVGPRSIRVPVLVDVAPSATSSSSYGLYTYNLYNFTDKAVQITDVDYDNSYMSAGAVYWPTDTVLQPGQSLPFQLANQNTGAETGNYLNFTVAPVDTSVTTTWKVGMVLINYGTGSGWQTYSSCTTTAGGSCSPSPTGAIYQTNNVMLYNANPTTITIPASDPDAQSEVLQNVCTNSQASCSFTVYGKESTFGDDHPPTQFSPVANWTPLGQSTDYTVGDTTTVEASYSVSDKVEAKLLDAVKASVSATYGQTLTQTHTYTYHQTLPMPSHTTATLIASSPVIRYTGTFTVALNNTTWVLQGVTVDDPDPTRSPKWVFTTPDITTPPVVPPGTSGSSAAVAAAAAGDAESNEPADLFELLRREIAYTLFGDRKVVIDPIQLAAQTTGARLVTGNLRAEGPNGDPVTYTVLQQPANGTVFIHADGTYTYTPDEGFPASGGVDGFLVSVTNSAIHLPNILGEPQSRVTRAVRVSVAPEALGATQNYQVWNLTSSSLHLNRYLGGAPSSSGDMVPRVGTVLAPGESANFVLNSGETAQPLFTLSMDPNYLGAQWQVAVGNGQVTCNGGSGNCSQGYMLDSKGSESVVDASDPAWATYINSVLDKLCGAGATCAFVPTIFVHTQGDLRVADGTVSFENDSTGDLPSEDYTLTSTVAVKTSWSVSASVETKLSPIVTNTLSATWGSSTTQSMQFTQKVTIKLPAESTTTIYYADPVIRYYGTWVISYANEMIYIENAYADYPDPSGNGEFVLYAVPNSTA